MASAHELTGKITVSTYETDNLCFAVGISDSTHKIVRISLPQPQKEASIVEMSKFYRRFEVSDEYLETAKTISRLFRGEKICFDLEQLDLEVNAPKGSPKIKNSSIKTEFMRNVLVQTAKIPYGEVTTYKDLAEKLGTRAYRAVGSALGKNPFPIVIPCHRVVKSNMMIGEYGGGREMKKEILLNEGLRTEGDRIIEEDSKRKNSQSP